jgi:hypothetical protein
MSAGIGELSLKEYLQVADILVRYKKLSRVKSFIIDFDFIFVLNLHEFFLLKRVYQQKKQL